ncbi:hypothetical protein, conserved [Eimeria maxima]|uniref:Transmembrane protein n=1 Tax=Eimeria maxima TaxID=5804 RepID=U6M3K8_EIMMA|nr:hypothetical protein, conserved [Eimeria maxima]CDJ56285.1 hypothetical protein, conserved [Eimeria maxima]
MASKKLYFGILLVRSCFWLFVAVWSAGKQSACLSNTPGEVQEGSAELQVSNGSPPDTLTRLHARAVSQMGAIDNEFDTGLVWKKRFHLIALSVLFLAVLRAISIRRERETKRRAQREFRLPTKEPLFDAELEEGLLPSDEKARNHVVLPVEEPPKEISVPRARHRPQDKSLPKEPPKGPDAGRRQAEESEGELAKTTITVGRETRKEGPKERFTPEVPEMPATPQLPTNAGEEAEGERREEEKSVQQPDPLQHAQPNTQPSLPPFPEPSEVVLPLDVPEVVFAGHAVPTEPVSVQPDELQQQGPIVLLEDDDEVQELRAKRSTVTNLLEVAVKLVDELPPGEAQRTVDKLKADIETAEQAEIMYDSAKSYRDPNIVSIREQTLNALKSSLEKARGALLQLSTLAKQHGEEVHAYCSDTVSFTDTSELREQLKESLEAASIKLCIETLSSLGRTSITLQQESEDTAKLLNSAKFVDACVPEDFVQLYGALAAMNFRKKTLERLASLDIELNKDLLSMHRAWLMGKLQAERIPLEMDASLVQGLHGLLLQSRPSYSKQSAAGTTGEVMQRIKELIIGQHQDLDALNTAHDIPGVTAAYERAKSSNQEIKVLLQTQKMQLQGVLRRQPLSKAEAAFVSQRMEKIAETAVENSEESWRFAQSFFAEVSGNTQKVEAYPADGKASLEKVASKLKGSAVGNGTTNTVKKYFAEPLSQIEVAAKDHLARTQEMLELAKQARKYKLDKEELGSSALDTKTNLRVKAATTNADAALFLLRFRYFNSLSKEIEGLGGTLRTISASRFRPTSSGWVEVERLMDRFDEEKAKARAAQNLDVIPGCVEAMMQSSLQIWTLLERERLEQLDGAVRKPRLSLHGALRDEDGHLNAQ